MGASLLGRLAQGALVVLFVVATCFALIRLAPGDPFFRALDEASVPAEVRAAQLARFGYDRPIPEQFARYLGNVVRGDLGWSHSRGQPVAQAIATALPSTLLLVGTAGLLAFVVGVRSLAPRSSRRRCPSRPFWARGGGGSSPLPRRQAAIIALPSHT